MKKLLSNALLVLVLTTLYVGYAGRLSVFTIVSGLLVSTGLVLLLSKTGALFAPSFKLPYLVRYAWRFALVEIKEHLELSKIILRGASKIKPGFIEIPVSLESKTALAVIALTITNTPGTIAVDVDPGRKTMLVHWVDIKTEDPVEASRIILGVFERLAEKIFG